MKILHLDLETGGHFVNCLYFWDSPQNVKTYQISGCHLPELKRIMYLEDPKKLGQMLYKWLNGHDYFLAREIDRPREGNTVLAIYTDPSLSKLPWELLHDGREFLVNQRPALVPMRCYKVKGNSNLHSVQQRALNILFMVSSAQMSEPEIDYAAVETGILKATKDQPLSLHLVESGSLEELWQLVQTKEKNYFDLIHLVGQATFKNEQAYFISETRAGEPLYSTSVEIAEGLQYNFPRLLFISGCWSGYSGQNSIYLIAEELLKLGAQAVLAWGKPVLDDEILTATATLYQELAVGQTLIDSLVCTYQTLLKIESRDWYSLRFYVRGTLPHAFVTKGMKPPSTSSVINSLLPRRTFQKCLQVLKTSGNPELGIIILGNKQQAEITTQLSNVLSDYQKIFWQRQINPAILVSKLSEEINNEKDFKYQLRDIFRKSQTSWLFIFNEFEWNLNYKNDKYTLKPQIAEILKALLWAIREGNFPHRIIINSRYEFSSNLFHSFYLLPSLAERNLETQLELEENIQVLISHCLLYEIAAPRSALEVISQHLPNYENNLMQAIDLGLIEVIEEAENRYQVASIIPQILPNIQLNKDTELYYLLCGKASKQLAQIWAKRENEDDEKWQEIFRLVLADKTNPRRFREGFTMMLAVQYNSQADLAYEKELRKFRDELSQEHLLDELESYLKEAQWQKADEETAWILYQIMVLKRTRGFKELYEQIPCDVLLELDQLWVNYSGGIFGFSVQNKIYHRLSKAESPSQDEMWNKLGDLIGWRKGQKWLDYHNLPFNREADFGNLPALYTIGAYTGGWGSIGSGLGWSQAWVLARRFSSVMSRLTQCKK